MRKPYISISPRSLASALILAKKAKQPTDLIHIIAKLNSQVEEPDNDEKLPKDITELKNKIDAALTESAKDDELDEEAEDHDVIMKDD